jgi:hypothetical protein
MSYAVRDGRTFKQTFHLGSEVFIDIATHEQLTREMFLLLPRGPITASSPTRDTLNKIASELNSLRQPDMRTP